MGHDRCTLKVRGLDCPVEAAALRAALEGSPGVGDLGFDFDRGTMVVVHDPAVVDPPGLVRRVAERAGMHAEVVGPVPATAPGLTVVTPPAPPSPWWSGRERLIATLGSGLALLAGSAIDWSGGPTLAARAAYALAVAFGAVDLLPRAVRSVRTLRLDIHALMTLAVLGAIALGQWDEAATVAFLFELSEALEAFSLARARRAVRSLLEVAPEMAEILEPDGATRVAPAGSVQVGDRVRVRAGEKIPVDGRVVAGRSNVDQKAITGESVPILREPGDPVFAGTVNGEGSLDVEADRPLGDALVSRIIEQVRAAQANRAPIERGIERFAAVYTPGVVAVALALMLGVPAARLALGSSPDWSPWFAKGLVVLVIACPCALVIATPVAVVGALAAAARRGILVKGGQFLEEFARLKVIAFDKTGTLTRGEPDVVEVVSASGGAGADADVLRIAAALGDRGGHVLGRAIARHARGLDLLVPEADAYTAVPGLGATGLVNAVEYHIGSHRYIDEAGLCPPDFHARFGRAEVEGAAGTSVALTAAAGPLGWIRLADRPRAEASGVLGELSALGVEVVMLTGDGAPAANAVGHALGIRDRRWGLLPADKAAAIAELDARIGPTGMVGDGLNDAPALAAARVSVALGGIGSGAALDTADVVLLADDLRGLPWLVRHGRRTVRLIRQNIALALGVKALVLLLAVLGPATLGMAIASDVGVTVLVTLNALRLLRAGR